MAAALPGQKIGRKELIRRQERLIYTFGFAVDELMQEKPELDETKSGKQLVDLSIQIFHGHKKSALKGLNQVLENRAIANASKEIVEAKADKSTPEPVEKEEEKSPPEENPAPPEEVKEPEPKKPVVALSKRK